MTAPNDFNKQVIEEFRKTGGTVTGRFTGATVLLLTTTGAKSGKEQTAPLVYLPDGDRCVVFASKGGAPTHPAWYHNLVAHKTAVVEVGTEKFTAEVAVAEGTERDQLYARQVERFPAFGDYEKQTERKIPVVILTRKA